LYNLSGAKPDILAIGIIGPDDIKRDIENVAPFKGLTLANMIRKILNMFKP
jgi:hypothetical protein